MTWPLAGLLMETFGWAYAFYVPAVITFIVTLIWFAVVFDSPGQHPRITTDEKEYIEKALGNVVSKKKVMQLRYISGAGPSRNILILRSVLFLIEFAAILEPIHIPGVPSADGSALRKLMGSLFPDNGRTKIHERGKLMTSFRIPFGISTNLNLRLCRCLASIFRTPVFSQVCHIWHDYLLVLRSAALAMLFVDRM